MQLNVEKSNSKSFHAVTFLYQKIRVFGAKPFCSKNVWFEAVGQLDSVFFFDCALRINVFLPNSFNCFPNMMH